MANTYNGTVTTKYLDLTGLGTFWGKVKTYVDDQDRAVNNNLTKKINDDDTAVRSYIESLAINGITVTSNKAADTEGTSLTMTIQGKDIVVGSVDGSSNNDYAEAKVANAIDDLDTRLEEIEGIVGENVINLIDVVDTPAEVDADGNPIATNYVYAKVDMSGEAASGTRKATITVDETKLDTKIAGIDEKIVLLEANAGVAGIRVVDTDSTEEAERKNLVEISISAVELNDKSDTSYTHTDGNTYTKSLVTLEVDENGLAEALSTIENNLADEIEDRKEDIGNLAGTGYIKADGATAGEWKKTNGTDFDVTYRNITALSDRLDQIDANLVTKIEEDTTNHKENWVELTVTEAVATQGTNDKAIKIYTDDSKLKGYTDGTNSAIAALASLTINDDYTPFTVTDDAGGFKVVTATPIDIKTDKIDRPATGNGNTTFTTLEAQLNYYDSAIGALSNATHFIGLTTTNPMTSVDGKVTIGGVEVTPAAGDVVIYNGNDADGEVGQREYIYDGSSWVELGDTTEEESRIDALETWVDTAFISSDDINKLAAGWTPVITDTTAPATGN